MWSASKMLFVTLCIVKLISEVKLSSNQASTSEVRYPEYTPPTTTPNNGAADGTPTLLTYDFDSYGNIIIQKVRNDERLPIFQNIDKSVWGNRIDSKEITLVKLIDTDGERMQHRIYMYSSPKHSKTENKGPIGNNTESKSMMLYTCMNCIFAEWVQNQLIEFVEHIPNMYKTLNAEENQNYRILDIGESKNHIEYIETETKHFINILFNFITVNSYNTVNSLVDMSLLRILVSINVLTHYILKHDGKSRVDITVNKILKKINEIQKFLVFNCDVMYSYYDNKYFFSYSMTKSKTDKYHIDIDEFLNELTEFGLETLFEEYSIQQMLLGRVLTSKTDVVMKDLKKLKLLVMGKPVEINDTLFNVIKESNNLDVMYWYMNIVLDGIIRLICLNTINQLKLDRILSINTTEGFKILSFLFTELTVDSEKLIEAFNFLASNQEITKAEKIALMNVMKDYINKPLNIDNNSDSLPMFPYFEFKTFEDKDGTSITCLTIFLNSIINRVSDYKCFVNIFELLTIEHKQNYLVYRKDPSKVYEFVYTNILFSSVGEKWQYSLKRYLDNQPKISTNGLQFRSESIDDKMCDLVITMYKYCVEHCVALIWDEKIAVENRNENNEEVSKIIYAISTMLEHIYKNQNIWNRFLMELLLDTMPVLEIKRDQANNWESENNNVLIRILYIIMLELNKYGLEACTSDKYDNLFFNNINYDTMGDHPNDIQAILNEWTKVIPTIKISNIKTLPNHYNSLIKIKTFYRDTLYNEYIRLYWRGELKTFNQIFDNVQFDILDPFYVYALYDVYFKFHMALLYYNFRAIADEVIMNMVLDDNFYINFLSDTERIRRIFIVNNIFSPELSNEFKFCVQFTVNALIKISYDTSNPSEHCTSVEKMIKKSGIYMVLKSSYRNIKSTYRADNQQLQLNLVENNERTNLLDKANEEITKYMNNRSNAVTLITEARKEYEEFRKFYNYINFEKAGLN